MNIQHTCLRYHMDIHTKIQEKIMTFFFSEGNPWLVAWPNSPLCTTHSQTIISSPEILTQILASLLWLPWVILVCKLQYDLQFIVPDRLKKTLCLLLIRDLGSKGRESTEFSRLPFPFQSLLSDPPNLCLGHWLSPSIHAMDLTHSDPCHVSWGRADNWLQSVTVLTGFMWQIPTSILATTLVNCPVPRCTTAFLSRNGNLIISFPQAEPFGVSATTMWIKYIQCPLGDSPLRPQHPLEGALGSVSA